MWDSTTIRMLLASIGESLYTTVFPALSGYMVGLPLGILLVISARDGIRPNTPLYKVLDMIVNITRSIPLLTLMVMVIPLTRLIVSTPLGSTTTTVSLTLSAALFIARMVESSLTEVNKGVVETAHSVSTSDQQIIFKVPLPEMVPSLINGATVIIAAVLGYSATVDFADGGGPGVIAVNYDYYRYQTDIVLIVVALLVIAVQIFQEIGIRSAGKSGKRKS